MLSNIFLILKFIQASAVLQFLLDTSERSIAMSQTYYDVDALESLLEERERDLELAARIGQTLLAKNRELVEQVTEARIKVH